MAKARIGHEEEARVLEALGVDMIDESEVLTPADPFYHIAKNDFTIPFVCGCTSLGEAVRRIAEGAAMIRTKGEAGTGNVVSAVKHARLLEAEIESSRNADSDSRADIVEKILEGYRRLEENSEIGAKVGKTPFGEIEAIRSNLASVLDEVVDLGRLPVVTFSAGGIATPADASLMMQLGAETVFVGSGIFKSDDPSSRAKAVVEATTHFDDPEISAKASTGLKKAMKGLDMSEIPEEERLQERGW